MHPLPARGLHPPTRQEVCTLQGVLGPVTSARSVAVHLMKVPREQVQGASWAPVSSSALCFLLRAWYVSTESCSSLKA